MPKDDDKKIAELPLNSELWRGILKIDQTLKEQGELSTRRHEDNQQAIHKIATEVAVANGRTSTNEKAIKLLGDSFAEMAKEIIILKGDKRVVMAIFALLVLFGGAIGFGFKLYIDKQSSETAKVTAKQTATEVVSQLLEEYNVESTQ